LAIRFDAFGPLALEDFLPELERIFGFEEIGLVNKPGEDVEIVNFPK